MHFFDRLSVKFQTLHRTLYTYKYHFLSNLGVKHHLIITYPEVLIHLMRGFSHHGIPASIVLLSGLATRGHCQEAAILMANVLTLSCDPFSLKKVSLEGLRIDPETPSRRDRFAKSWHYINEITEPDGGHWIVDTTSGLIYRKWLYWLLDFPRILKVVDLEELPELTHNREYCPIEDCAARRLAVPLLISMIENSLRDHPRLPYERPDQPRLQQEIDLFASTAEFKAAAAELRDRIIRCQQTDPDYFAHPTNHDCDPNHPLDPISVEAKNFWSIRKPPKSDPSASHPSR